MALDTANHQPGLPAIHHDNDAYESWAARMDDMAQRGGLEVVITRTDGTKLFARVRGSGVDDTDGYVGLRYQLTDINARGYGPEQFLRCDEFTAIRVL